MNIDKIIREEIQKLNETVNLDLNKFKEALAAVESGGDYTAENPKSSAVGKYQFLWNTWNKNITQVTGVSTKEEFLNSPEAQEKFFKYYVNTELKPQVATLKRDSTKSDVALAALIHFQGYPDAKRYLKTGTETAPEINMPIEKYLAKVEKTYYGTSAPEVAPKETPTDTETSPVQPITTNKENLLDIDKLQRVLDFAGFVPVIGDALDVVNGLIYLARGKYIDFVLSIVALVPAIGSAIAVPMRVAFKSGTKYIKPNVLKSAMQSKPGMWRSILLTLTDKKLLGSSALDANTLKTLAENGDDIARVLLDSSQSLRKAFPTNKTIADFSKLGDNAAESMRLLQKEAAELAQTGIKSGEQVASTIKTMTKDQLDNYLKVLTLGTKPSRVANFIFSKRLIKNVIGKDDAVLSGLSKRFSKDFDKVMADKGLYTTIFNKSMRSGGFGQEILSKESLSVLNSILQKNGFNGVITSASNLQRQLARNPSLKQIINRSIPDMLNEPAFAKFAQDVNVYKQSFIQQQLALGKNLLSKNVGIEMLKKGLLPPAGKKLGNINAFKIFAKTNYIGREMIRSENEWMQNVGKSLIKFSLGGYELTGILSAGAALEPETKETAARLAQEVETAQKQLELSMEQLPYEDLSTWSEEDLELLNIFAETK